MSRYRLSEKAIVDLDRISQHIAADNPAAAANWLEDVFHIFESAGQFPEIGRQRNELATGLRSIPVGDYVVFYRHEARAKRVLIACVFHGAQDIPRRFQK